MGGKLTTKIYTYTLYMHIWCIYTHIMLYIYTVFIYTFTYYTPTLILFMVTDALYRLLENWYKVEIFYFSDSTHLFYFWLDNSIERFLFLFLCNSWVKKTSLWKVERVGTFSQVGRSPIEHRTGGVIRGFRLTQCVPRMSSPADKLGYVGWGCGEEVGGQWLSTTGKRFP